MKNRDLTLPADLTRDRSVGPVRVRRPVYRDLLPPCNNACPAGENIQAWLAKVVEGDDRGAWEILVQENPMPAVHGRVCYHPCESSCNRGLLESPVSIHAVERYLGDKALEEQWPLPRPPHLTGKHVLVVGAGPAGLSCAYHLAKVGHTVTILEAGPLPGGMMHFGIPAYRLPRNILEAEVQRIVDLGVQIRYNHKVEDLESEMQSGGFDAAFPSADQSGASRPAHGDGRRGDPEALEALRADGVHSVARHQRHRLPAMPHLVPTSEPGVIPFL